MSTSGGFYLDAFPGTSLRVFGIWYRDRRDLTFRAHGPAGSGPLEIFALGPGRVDLLFRGATQFGDWQDQSQGGYAYALEAGYRLPDVWGAPWRRVGLDRGSGDADPDDGNHETFFQILPTSRLYARFPFYNLMNDQDLFAQLLRLSEDEDFLYSGGGATWNRVFGYSRVDAHVFGRGTLDDACMDADPDYAFVEATVSF